MENKWYATWKHLFSKNPKAGLPIESEFFESVFELSSEAYFVYSKVSQEIIRVNRMASNLFEIPPEISLEGLYVTQMMMRYLAADSPNLEFLMNNFTESWTGEAEFTTHSKNSFLGQVNTDVLSSVSGNQKCQVLSIRDVTERRKKLNEIVKSEKKAENAVKSKIRFLSCISHELRTPLNGIMGSSDLLLTDPGLNIEMKEHINTIKYSSGHMLSIINDILDYSKLDAKKIEFKEAPFNIFECINNIYSSFSLQFKKKNINFIANFPEESLKDIEIISDEIKLTQIVNNLLANSLKFTNSGSVEFIVKIVELTNTDIKLYFEVKDTGIGVAKDQHYNIFNAFSQVQSDDLSRNYGGTGLGLTISRQLLNMLGGSLQMESELQKGSRFYYTILFRIAAPPIPKINTCLSLQQHPKDIRGIRVLIVEDNEINERVLSTFLNRWQVRTKVAITGIHAIELVKYHKFDLILMDLEMPEMDGYTAIKKLHEMGIHVPVIAFTATLIENMDIHMKEAGFIDYVIKPFRPSELKMKIEMYSQRKVDYA